MRNPLLLLLITSLCLTAAPASGAPVAVVPPASWSVQGCATWNCAVSAMVMGNGNPFLLVLPTRNAAWPWVIVRREQSGGVQAPPHDFPYEIEVFDSMAMAMARYASFTNDRAPLMVTTPDGMTLVLYMRNVPVTRSRAAGR